MTPAVDAAPPPGSRVVRDRDELAEFFSDQPAVHIYALADLDEPFWSSSRWFRRGDVVIGLVSLPSGEGVACYAVATRDPAGTLHMLRELAPSLPPGLLITGPVGLAETLRSTRRIRWSGPHLRYELTDRHSIPPPDPRVSPLDRSDVVELQALYDAEPGAAFFLPHMLDDDTFVGIRDPELDGQLVAAAGTHVMSAMRRIAAIGAVYVSPPNRGRGLGRAVTTGVLERLDVRVDRIGLNAATANTAARRLYEAMGFVAIHRYEEAELA